MANRLKIFLIFWLVLGQTTFAEMLLFVGEGCSFCEELRTELINNDFYGYFDIREYEIYNNEQNLTLYLEKSQELGYTGGGVPLIVDDGEYVEGKDPILAYLNQQKTGEPATASTASTATRLSQEDSQKLAELLEDSSQNSPAAPSNSSPSQTTTASIEKIGLITFILGLTALSTFLYRRRKKR